MVNRIVSVGDDFTLPAAVKVADVNLPEASNAAALTAALAAKAPLASPAFTGTPTGITKTHVGLGSVDNTADADKPISTAQAAGIALKAPIASPTFTGTVAGVTKTHVGLANVDNTSDVNKPVSTATATSIATKEPTLAAGTTAQYYRGDKAWVTLDKTAAGLANVDNTSDANKPVSTAGQTALNLKANLASPTFTGTVSGITATMVGLGSVNNTTDAAKPVSTAQQAALDLKAPLASPTFTGTVAGVTKTMVGLSNVDNTTDAAKPVSTAQQTALDGKSNTGHAHSAADLTSGTVPEARIPLRLSSVCTTITDWNSAITNGWFFSASGATNAPTTGNFIGTVVATGTSATQHAWAYTTDSAADTKTYRRDLTSSAWSAWDKTLETTTELDARYSKLTSVASVTAKHHQAVGDGTTDDTVALQAWLDSTNKNKILGNGIYRVTANLNSTVAGATITGPGVLKADTVGIDVLNITGVDTTVNGIEVDGNDKARYLIYSTAANTTVERCGLHNAYSAASSARGVFISTPGGATIRHNRIWNINAPGNETTGDGNGFSRGIVLHSATTPTANSYCHDNNIDNIYGEEGDGIAVLHSDTVALTYLTGYSYINNNIIRNCGRRHIKIQASSVVAKGNWCYATAAFTPTNPSAVIDVIQGKDIWIVDNRVEDTGMSSPVSIAGDSGERISRIAVTGNYLKENEGTSPVVYTSYADKVTIANNVMVGGSYYVSGGTSDDLIVSANVCREGTVANDSFNLTSSVTGKVRLNTIPTGRAVGTSTNVVFDGNA